MKRRAGVVVAMAAVGLFFPWLGTVHASGVAPKPMAVPAPAYVQRLGPIRPLGAGSLVRATLVLAPRHPAALEAAARAAAARSAGHGRRRVWMTARAVLNAYGPRPAAAAALVSQLRRRGFSAVDAGWVVNAAAPAGAWERMLGLKLGTVRQQGALYRVQATSGVVPAWMAGAVTGVDGLTTLPPPTQSSPALHRAALRHNPALRPAAKPRGSAATPLATAQSGAFTVTAFVPGGIDKATGQPVHIVLQATLNGQVDYLAGLGSQSVSGATSTGQSLWGRGLYGWGSASVAVYAHHPLSAQLSVTMYSNVSNGQPAAGALSATVTLPILTWTGPSTIQALNAQQVNSVYHAAGVVAAGQSAGLPPIGLYEGGPPTAAMLADLSNYAQANALPPASVQTVNVDYGTPAPGSGGEENLDLQAVEATAPGAPLIVYSDPGFDMAAVLNTVGEQQAVSAFSMSIAFSGQSYLAPLTDALTLEGITLIASSGDWGTIAGCVPPTNAQAAMYPASVCQPASFETVAAVGGTDVSVSQSGHLFYTQAWGGAYLSYLPSALEAYVLSQFAASGGGFSQSQPVPSWQAPLLPAGAAGKGVPDVALLANPGVAGLGIFARRGGYEVGGGTSLGAPLLAGWAADVAAASGSALGAIAPSLYALAGQDPQAFTQAVRGDNGQYQITSQDGQPGTWNPITGLGSPNIDTWAAFVENGNQLPGPVLSAPAAALYGSTVTLAGSWAGQPGATFQYWWQDPRDGVWHNSGTYAAGPYSFSPPVPGTFPVLAFGEVPGGGPVRTNTVNIEVSTRRPMVSNLVVSYAGQSNEPAGSTVMFTAQATDAGSAPEYQFWVHGPDNRWQVVQNYSPQNTFALSNLAPGSYAVAAYALDQQQVAAGAWNQVYGYAAVINVDSSVSVGAPAGGSVGVPVSVAAAARNLTNPVYQMWVQSPAGIWSQSGAYTHASQFSFTPGSAGTYRVVIYAKDPYAPNTSAFAVEATASVAVGP